MADVDSIEDLGNFGVRNDAPFRRPFRTGADAENISGNEGVDSVQIKISARHGHLSDATQQFIREKAQKLLHFFERIMSIEVTVDLKNDIKLVEFLVSAEHKHDFVARESNTDILAAVDLAVDKLEGQLRRYKEKVQDRRRTPSAGEVTGMPALEEASEE
jgi:putative sigma-54 modulation protein